MPQILGQPEETLQSVTARVPQFATQVSCVFQGGRWVIHYMSAQAPKPIPQSSREII